MPIPTDSPPPEDQEEKVSLTPAVSPETTPPPSGETATPQEETPSPQSETPLGTPPPAFEPPPTPEPPPATPPSPPEATPPSEPAEVLRFEEGSKLGVLKKLILPLLVLLILAGAVVLVIRFVLPRLAKPTEITLTYWGLWEPDTVMKGVVADWEREHPDIKINYLRNAKQDYRERLQSALARGEGPDIFRFHSTWVPMLKNELDPVPPSVMDAATFESAFYPVIKSDLRSGTDYLGLPLEIDTLALFYNEEIFQSAGKTPPTTWDDLRTLASALTVRDEQGKIKTAGAALGTTTNVDHWSDILALMMIQNGANLASPTDNLAKDALTYYTLFTLTDRIWDATLPSSTLAFATGKLAMYFGFSWDVFEIKNINPDLVFKVVPVPQLSGTNVNWASYWVEGVSKKSEKKEAAWEFMKYLSSREVMQKLYQAESQVRLFGEPYSRVEMADLVKADPMVAPFLQQASSAQSWYLASRTYDNGINDRMVKYFEDAVNSVNDGEDPEKALTTAASGIAQLLSQYGLGSYTAR
jgi:multiple sugar transport system substrate-binding protein